MPHKPNPDLHVLRGIGWTHWDPIGLLSLGEAWQDTPFADEYDRYLQQAFSMLTAGKSIGDITAYLTDIASSYMGLSQVSPSRAEATARALESYFRKLSAD